MYLIMLVTNSLSNRQFTSSENRSKSTINLFQISHFIWNSGFSSKFNFSSAPKLSWLQYLFNNSILVRQLKLSKLVELLYLAFEIQDCILELGKGSWKNKQVWHQNATRGARESKKGTSKIWELEKRLKTRTEYVFWREIFLWRPHPLSLLKLKINLLSNKYQRKEPNNSIEFFLAVRIFWFRSWFKWYKIHSISGSFFRFPEMSFPWKV